ncbi:MAG: hypothetical protein K8S16_20455 [Bacteroidales bacterium]|nr:hypothetical protein [Bacteroidales bacterium]
MKVVSGRDLYYGILNNNTVYIEYITNYSLPKIRKKFKFLFSDVINETNGIKQISDVYFKKQFVNFKKELLFNKRDFENKIQIDTMYIFCLNNIFFEVDFQKYFYEKTLKSISKIYKKFQDFQEKREIEIEVINEGISKSVINAFHKTLLDKPHKKHSKGLFYIICRNQVINFIKRHIDLVNINDENIAQTELSTNREDFIEKSDNLLKLIFNSDKEYNKIQSNINEHYEKLLEAFRIKANISEKQCRILFLKEVCGLSHIQIAEILGYQNPETSKSTLNRAMQKIRMILKNKDIKLNDI